MRVFIFSNLLLEFSCKSFILTAILKITQPHVLSYWACAACASLPPKRFSWRDFLPYDGTSKIWSHRQTTLCSCCRRNSNEHLQTKIRIWTKSHYGSCLTSKCVNKSLSEMVILSFALVFFSPSPAQGLELGVLIPHSRIWKGWRGSSEILNFGG